MKSILIFVITLTALNGYSQVAATWKGNTPGHELEWGYASNWSNNRIPDQFTDVVIPYDETLGKNYPVVQTATVEINSICIRTGAQIQIEYTCEIRLLDADTVLRAQTITSTKELVHR